MRSLRRLRAPTGIRIPLRVPVWTAQMQRIRAVLLSNAGRSNRLRHLGVTERDYFYFGDQLNCGGITAVLVVGLMQWP